MTFTPPALTMADIMVKTVLTVKPDMTLHSVVDLLVRNLISGAPVVDSTNRVLTVIGEGATLRLAASEGLKATVAHCLTKLTPDTQIITLRKENTFADADRLFLKHNIHRIPIVDGNMRLVGLVSRTTILKMFVEAHHGKKIRSA
jgi:CBS domain-containing protein